MPSAKVNYRKQISIKTSMQNQKLVRFHIAEYRKTTNGSIDLKSRTHSFIYRFHFFSLTPNIYSAHNLSSTRIVRLINTSRTFVNRRSGADTDLYLSYYYCNIHQQQYLTAFFWIASEIENICIQKYNKKP